MQLYSSYAGSEEDSRLKIAPMCIQTEVSRDQ